MYIYTYVCVCVCVYIYIHIYIHMYIGGIDRYPKTIVMDRSLSIFESLFGGCLVLLALRGKAIFLGAIFWPFWEIFFRN